MIGKHRGQGFRVAGSRFRVPDQSSDYGSHGGTEGTEAGEEEKKKLCDSVPLWLSHGLRIRLARVCVSASLLAVALLLGCGGGPLEPAQLTPDQDICSHCRMTIVQPELAAQAVRPGSVDFFDDVGCLATWMRQRPHAGEMALFVADFETGEWLKAQDAFYAQSPSMPTPMHSGVTASRTAQRAEAAARRLQGRVLSWDEVLQEAKP